MIEHDPRPRQDFDIEAFFSYRNPNAVKSDPIDTSPDRLAVTVADYDDRLLTNSARSMIDKTVVSEDERDGGFNHPTEALLVPDERLENLLGKAGEYVRERVLAEPVLVELGGFSKGAIELGVDTYVVIDRYDTKIHAQEFPADQHTQVEIFAEDMLTAVQAMHPESANITLSGIDQSILSEAQAYGLAQEIVRVLPVGGIAWGFHSPQVFAEIKKLSNVQEKFHGIVRNREDFEHNLAIFEKTAPSE